MRALALSLAAVFAVGAVALAGDRSAPQTQLIQRLNGSPTYLGTIATDAGTTRNSCNSTSGLFDAGYGDIVMVQCTTDHWVKAGVCATTATNTGTKLIADEKFYTMLKADQFAIAALPADAGVIGGCNVYHQE